MINDLSKMEIKTRILLRDAMRAKDILGEAAERLARARVHAREKNAVAGGAAIHEAETALVEAIRILEGESI
jgi:hypothetical protein